ncbi:MAG: hypothetical protein WAU88_04150 [Candidatus Zixiibacteriota bacterium]
MLADMRIVTLSAIFLLSLSFSAIGATHDAHFDSTQVSSLIAAQKLLFNDQFIAADSFLESYSRQYPDDPAGLLFRASGLLAQMIDREEPFCQSQFDSLLQRAKKLAEESVADPVPRRSAWMHLFLGHDAAYRSLFQSRFGSFTSAISNGYGAKGEYEKALAADSTLLDIYAGLGSFHYWKSAKAGFLRWFGIFKNDKNRGITELKRAADSSLLSREAARNSLIWVYFDSDKPDSAEILVREAMTRYPNSRSVLWPLAQSLYDRKKYAEAIGIYEEIRARISSDPGNYFNFVECDYYIALCNDRLDQESEAKEAALKLGDYYDAIPKDTRKRQQGKLGYLKRLATSDE